MKILVFDTESTDKLPLVKGGFYFLQPEFDINVLGTDYLSNPDSVESKTIKRWPTVLQLSYIVYDTENPSEVKIFDKYINVASDKWIHPEAEAKHHINAAKILSSPPEKRTDIKDGINEIVSDMRSVDVVIGHNVKFDKNILIGELLKLNLPEMKDDLSFLLDNSHFYCTMDETKRICNLQMAVNYTDKKTGAQKVMYRIKSPKLSEAYEHFFGYAPTGELLHDALVDVIVCLRVYLKYKLNTDVCGKNQIITDYILKISPPGYSCPTEEVEKSFVEIVNPITEDVTIVKKENNEDATQNATRRSRKRKIGGNKSRHQTKKNKYYRSRK